MIPTSQTQTQTVLQNIKKCECGKEFETDMTDIISGRKYCSKQCATKYKRKGNQILIKCSHCFKAFKVFLFELKGRLKNYKKLYCSRRCCGNARKGKSRQKYENHYWCSECGWIPKKDSILKEAGTLVIKRYVYHSEFKSSRGIDTQKYILKRDMYYCPKCNLKLRLQKS